MYLNKTFCFYLDITEPTAVLFKENWNNITIYFHQYYTHIMYNGPTLNINFLLLPFYCCLLRRCWLQLCDLLGLNKARMDFTFFSLYSCSFARSRSIIINLHFTVCGIIMVNYFSFLCMFVCDNGSGVSILRAVCSLCF